MLYKIIKPNIIKRFCHHHTPYKLNNNPKEQIQSIETKIDALTKDLKDMNHAIIYLSAASWVNTFMLLLVSK